ncbi:MAG: acyltransferase [Gemmataceae bacterium]|nr:acyltransferase [Gemmataceae bacterium]
MRNLLVYAGAVALTPLWLPARAGRRLGREGWFAGCSELLSLVPGRLGIFVRRSFYAMALDDCATDVHIGFGTTLAHPQVTIGRGVYVGNRGTLGMCVLEDDVTLGSNVDLLSGRRQHGFSDPSASVQSQPGAYTPVTVGRAAWVGNSCVVMADVGAGAVVGAGSVVVHGVPVGAVAVGNPATVKRTRAAA